MEIKKCPQCGLNNDESVAVCERCAYSFTTAVPHEKTDSVPALFASFSDTSSSWRSRLLSFIQDFLMFRFLVTTHIIQVVYIAGAWVITIGGLLQIGAVAYAIYENGYESALREGRETLILWVVAGVLGLIIGNLFWRLICELWILFFSMHDQLVSINKKQGGFKDT
jgi:rubredoxin